MITKPTFDMIKVMVIDNPYSSAKKEIEHFYECPEELSIPTYAKYKVLDTEVLIGNRPNISKAHSGKLFAMNDKLYNSIDSFINVSDNFVEHRADKQNVFLPFNEEGNPTIETVASFLQTLDYQIRVLRLKRIYIHCDLGSHRAPSMFGFYLFVYHPKTIKNIVKNKELINLQPIEWSNPRNYLRDYLNDENLFLYTFLRNFKKNRAKHTSLEDIIKSPNNKVVRDLLYNERNWTPVSGENEPFFGTMRYGKQMIESLIKEFKPSVSKLYSDNIRTPFMKKYIDIHILLGTKNGIFWRDHGFGTKNEKKHQESKKNNKS